MELIDTTSKKTNSPQIARLLENERDQVKKWQPLLEELKSIPHLPIPIEFDLDDLRNEAKQVAEWYPHRLHPCRKLPAEYLSFHESSFRGQCLVDIQEDIIAGMSDSQKHLHDEPCAKFDENSRLRFFITSLGKEMPKTISALQLISPYLNRTRIINTPPGGGIPWHSHHNGIYNSNYLRLCIVHIPLHTSPVNLHSVRDYRSKEADVYSENYQVGQAYIFNSWHDHEFWNRSNQDRLTIISYFNFTDEALLRFLEPIVQSYAGPRIPK